MIVNHDESGGRGPDSFAKQLPWLDARGVQASADDDRSLDQMMASVHEQDVDLLLPTCSDVPAKSEEIFGPLNRRSRGLGIGCWCFGYLVGRHSCHPSVLGGWQRGHDLSVLDEPEVRLLTLGLEDLEVIDPLLALGQLLQLE